MCKLSDTEMFSLQCELFVLQTLGSWPGKMAGMDQLSLESENCQAVK